MTKIVILLGESPQIIKVSVVLHAMGHMGQLNRY
jgi:hypothetical protein